MSLVPRLLLQTAIWVVALGALLFLSAGTLRWPGAWVLLGLMAAIGTGIGLWLARRDPALLAERMKLPVQRGQKGWDQVLMGVFLALWSGWLVLMGLDMRFAWSQVPGWASVLGAVGIMLGYGLVVPVFRANSFAAPVVKVQAERGHRVIDTGPYAVVRHPMYAGALPIFVGIPLLLGSWWGLLGVPAVMVVIALRAVREERVLAAGLPGYAEYARRVRWRLLPGVW